MAARVLNRADWLTWAHYTMAEAIEHIGPAWVMLIPEAAKLLAYDDIRGDGEPLVGYDDIDYPTDVAHPGNG